MGLRTLAHRSSYAAVAAAMSLGGINASTASAVTPPPPFHGITLQKTCVDPVKVGDPYECAFQITNSDDNSESITVKSVQDQVHAASGNVDSGELIGSLTWATSGGASCTPPGPTTTCTLPVKNSAITSNLNSFYTVQPADFNIDPVTHALDDDVKIIWAEPVCLHGGCPVGNKTSSTGASATILLFNPSIETLLSPQGPVAIGAPVQDQATIFNASADAGGTVHYAVYSNNTCATLVQDLGTKPVTNGVVGPSDVWTPLAAGNFWFQATYSGDPSNVGPVSSACLSEPIAVSPNSPTVDTLLSPPGPVAIGTPVTDQATINNATANAGGTVSYAVYSNNTCTALVQALGTKVVNNGLVGPSDVWTPLAAGNFWFQATYSGDPNNTGPVKSPCTSEPITVSPNTPSVTTLIVPAGPLTIGASAHDTAQITGATANAGGTISYQLFSNNNCIGLIEDLTPAVNTVVNGIAPDSKSHQFNSAGTFYFYAVYSGDANNAGPVNSGCAAEPLVVNAPGVNIVKFTNGADANDPDGADVPNIIPGQPVTWTYQVTNTGTTHPTKADVVITDNQTGVTPVFDHEQSGNGDQIFDPGEIWIYKATGTALNLTAPPAGVITQPGVCTHNGTETARTAYINLGTATIPGATDNDPSSYCNPPPVVNTPLHFLCYEVKSQGLVPGVVTSTDQFGSFSPKLAQMHKLCNPANKNDEDASAVTNENHIDGYEASSSTNPAQGRKVKVTDQFGTIIEQLAQVKSVFVPSAKSLIGPVGPLAAPGIDHYTCYVVKLSGGFTTIPNVKVQDEFGTLRVNLQAPNEFCAPANINGKQPGAQTHAQHYNCYNAVLAAGQTFKPLANVWVADEFQARKVTLTNHVWELCVPATKSLSGFAPFHSFF